MQLLGLTNVEVVTILKVLPQYVRIVCARKRRPASDQVTSDAAVHNLEIPPNNDSFFTENISEQLKVYLSRNKVEKVETNYLFH